MFTVEAAPQDAREQAALAFEAGVLCSALIPSGEADMTFWRGAVDSPAATLRPSSLGLLAETLERDRVRSAVLAMAAGAAPSIVDALAAGTLPAEGRSLLHDVMVSTETGVEPSALTQTVVEILARICGHLNAPHAYGVLSMLAWWQGLTQEATASAVTAVILDRGNQTGLFTLRHLQAGNRPGWQHRQDAAFADIADSFNKEH